MKLFVYGTLQSTESNHAVLQSTQAEFICDVQTSNKYSKGYTSFFPYITENESTDFIKGELYEVPKENIKIIDYFEGEPDLFYRKLIHVLDTDTGKVYKAYCYFYKD